MDFNLQNQGHLQTEPSEKSKSLANKRIFYSQVEQFWKKGSYDMIEIQNKLYIFQGYEDYLNMYDIQTGIYEQLPIKGTIISISVENKFILLLTRLRLYLFQMIDEKIKKLSQFQVKHQLSKHQDIILWKKDDYLLIIKLGVQNKLKTIFKIKVDDYFRLDKSFYDKKKGLLLQIYNQSHVIVLDVISKEIKQLNLGFPKPQLISFKHIKFVENGFELLFSESGNGLFLKKINYNCKIEEKKFFYYEIEDFKIFEENQMIVMLTQNYYVKFDSDYNIISKFQIWANQKGLNFYKLYKFVERKQISYIVFKYKFRTLSDKFRIYQQNDNLNEGDVWIQEVQNYHVEFQQPIDAKISYNEQYLAIKSQYLLILYQMQQKIEKKYFLDTSIGFRGFSINQNNIYMTFQQKVTCYKFQQNMKIRYIQFNKAQVSIQRFYLPIQNGICAYINSRGVRVYSQQKKQIYRINYILNLNSQYKSENFNETLLIFDNNEFFIFRLPDRKLRLKMSVKSIDCKLKNEQQIMILKSSGQLQLWDFQAEFVLQQQVIFDNLEHIIKYTLEKIILGTRKEIIVLDQSLKIIERFYTEGKPLLATDNYIFLENSQNCQDQSRGFSLIQRK